MTDLKSPFLIHLKGWLFLLIVIAAGAGIYMQLPTWRVGMLIVIVIWASARFYYYLFYVIEKYVDPNYKFAGVYSAIRYLIRGKKNKPSRDSD